MDVVKGSAGAWQLPVVLSFKQIALTAELWAVLGEGAV